MKPSNPPKTTPYSLKAKSPAMRPSGTPDRLPRAQPSGWILLIGPQRLNLSMLYTIARLADLGPVQVIDGGLRYDPFIVGAQLQGGLEAMARIHDVQTYSCHQMLAALKSLETCPPALVVLDLLAAFFTASLPAPERKRLLNLCLEQLKRLASPCPDGIPERTREAWLSEVPTSNTNETSLQTSLKQPGDLGLIPLRVMVSVYPPREPGETERELLEMTKSAAVESCLSEMAGT